MTTRHRTMIVHASMRNLRVPVSRNATPWRLRWYKARPKNAKPKYPTLPRLSALPDDTQELVESDSDLDVSAAVLEEKYQELQKELEPSDEEPDMVITVGEESGVPADSYSATSLPEYRIPHRFVGFDPRRMDLEDFPRLRTDFDGKPANLLWSGTECQRCGLQIRRERRTNRESSLNVYANPGIPDDLLRHCPEQKQYPVLWRTRDPTTETAVPLFNDILVNVEILPSATAQFERIHATNWQFLMKLYVY